VQSNGLGTNGDWGAPKVYIESFRGNTAAQLSAQIGAFAQLLG
jgi:hypothetical protein